MKSLDILIVGVGGQGTLLASRVLGKYALERGYDVKLSEVHGMAQRGGSVMTYVRLGEKIASPIIDEGGADLILAFEKLEALRYAHYLKPGGEVLYSTQEIMPMPVVTGAAEYPQGIEAQLKGTGIDALQLALEAGNSKSANSVMLGALCKKLGLDLLNNQVDIGVRVELPALVFEHITDVVYESKLVYRTKQYGDTVRTFCMNPYGHVVTENVEGINTVNGHSYSDESLRSDNTNFALLVSNKFTEPFDQPYRYGKHIASLSNMLAGGVLVQRFGDLVKGVRTNEHRLAQSTVHPTLTAATPGDLSLALPKRQLDDIIEMIYALDKIAPGTANYDTLLYGAEVKFYSARLRLTEELETQLPNFFAVGDGAGVTRGLAQAGASGVKAARTVISRIK